MSDVGKFLAEGSGWTNAEKAVIKWQFKLNGDFRTALWEAIKRADEGNLDRLALGFPDEVYGFRQWSQGDLGIRLLKAWLDI